MSSSFTVFPTCTVLVSISDSSIILAYLNLFSNSAILVSFSACAFLASSYSEFSDKSPKPNATFILYEDENDNYNYEKGVYSTITFRLDDSNRTLQISEREGRYPGMLEKRKFKVVLVNHRSGEGDKPLKGGKMVNYTGTSIEVKV